MPPFFLILFYKRPLRINPPPPLFFSNSLKSCGLNLITNGTEDCLIRCFKEGEPCQNGREQFRPSDTGGGWGGYSPPPPPHFFAK